MRKEKKETSKGVAEATPTSGTGIGGNAIPRTVGSLLPTPTGGNSSISSSRPPLSFSQSDGSPSVPAPLSATPRNGGKSGAESARETTKSALSISKENRTPARKSIKGDQELDGLKEKFQSGLYSMLMEPGTMQGLRELLKCGDKVLRVKAWELALKHGMPIFKEPEDARGAVIVNMNIPRPPMNITPGGQE